MDMNRYLIRVFVGDGPSIKEQWIIEATDLVDAARIANEDKRTQGKDTEFAVTQLPHESRSTGRPRYVQDPPQNLQG